MKTLNNYDQKKGQGDVAQTYFDQCGRSISGTIVYSTSSFRPIITVETSNTSLQASLSPLALLRPYIFKNPSSAVARAMNELSAPRRASILRSPAKIRILKRVSEGTRSCRSNGRASAARTTTCGGMRVPTMSSEAQLCNSEFVIADGA